MNTYEILLNKALNALEMINELHSKEPGIPPVIEGGWCRECSTVVGHDEYLVSWPCPTLNLILLAMDTDTPDIPPV